MIYEYECQFCKKRLTAVRRMADRDDGPICCGAKSEKRIFSAPFAEFPEWNVNYKCVATGEEITSLKQRKEVMKKHGLVDAKEFGEPDFDKMARERKEFHETANQSPPAELADAMKREGLSDLL